MHKLSHSHSAYRKSSQRQRSHSVHRHSSHRHSLHIPQTIHTRHQSDQYRHHVPDDFFMYSWIRGRLSKNTAQLHVKGGFVLYKTQNHDEDAHISVKQIFKIIIGQNKLLPECLVKEKDHLTLTICKRVNKDGKFTSHFFIQHHEKEHSIYGFCRRVSKYLSNHNKILSTDREGIMNAIEAIKQNGSGCAEIEVLSASIVHKLKAHGQRIRKKHEQSRKRKVSLHRRISVLKQEYDQILDSKGNDDDKIHRAHTVFQELQSKYEALLTDSKKDKAFLSALSEEITAARSENVEHRDTINKLQENEEEKKESAKMAFLKKHALLFPIDSTDYEDKINEKYKELVARKRKESIARMKHKGDVHK